jgi:hypothetical protein
MALKNEGGVSALFRREAAHDSVSAARIPLTPPVVLIFGVRQHPGLA